MDVSDGEVAAAGGVVTRPSAGGELEVLAVHRPRYDDWSLPKGKLERGESYEAAAHREVAEETGWEVTLGAELPEVRYRDRHGRPKRVRYWHMTPVRRGPFAPNDEIDDVRWLSLSEAATLLSYEADRQLLSHLEVEEAE